MRRRRGKEGVVLGLEIGERAVFLWRVGLDPLRTDGTVINCCGGREWIRLSSARMKRGV